MRSCFAAGLAALVISFSVLAQKPSSSPEEVFKTLNWVTAPQVGKFDTHAEIKLTDQLFYLNNTDTDKFLQALGNLPTSNSYAIGNSKSNWFAVLKFIDDGLVKDDEKIDANELMETLRQQNVETNKVRRDRGLPEMNLAGWFFPPRYDPQSKRLEWGLEFTSPGQQGKTVNITTKLLGRRGYYNVILVTDPTSANDDLIAFKAALKQVDFVAGEKYSEWREGDKVAAYGLSALVLGGAAAVASKKGFWAAAALFLAKMWKLVAVGVLALVAFVWKLFKKKTT